MILNSKCTYCNKHVKKCKCDDKFIEDWMNRMKQYKMFPIVVPIPIENNELKLTKNQLNLFKTLGRVYYENGITYYNFPYWIRVDEKGKTSLQTYNPITKNNLSEFQ